MASVRNTESHRQIQAGRITVQPRSSTQREHQSPKACREASGEQLGARQGCPPGGSERMCNTDATAYPLRTPRTRLRTKNEPRMIRLTKYTQGHSHPIASFTCKM